MIEEFQNILRSPKNQPENYLKKSQDLILNTLEALFPPDYDFRQLGYIYDNPEISSDTSKLTYYLVEYFSQMISNNFISIHSYSCLEEQTQKSQSTIRSHIKVKLTLNQLEQEMKMYLEHLEGKILKYENYINYYIRKLSSGRGSSLGLDEMPNNKDTLLMKERLSLIRKNDFLQRKLVQKQNQLRRVKNLIGTDKLDLVKSIEEKDKIALSKIQHSRAQSLIVYQPVEQQQPRQTKIETAVSFPATLAESVIQHHPISVHPPPPPRPTDSKSLLININGNNNEFNYYIGKSKTQKA